MFGNFLDNFDGGTIGVPLEIGHIEKSIKHAVRALCLDLGTTPQSIMLHELFPIPSSNRHHICGASALLRHLTRLRPGNRSCNTFLHRHGLSAHDSCDCCLFVDGRQLDTADHAFLMCQCHFSSWSF